MAPPYEVLRATNEVSEALTRRWAVGPANFRGFRIIWLAPSSSLGHSVSNGIIGVEFHGIFIFDAKIAKLAPGSFEFQ